MTIHAYKNKDNNHPKIKNQKPCVEPMIAWKLQGFVFINHYLGTNEHF